jgi:Holliday junction resolvase
MDKERKRKMPKINVRKKGITWERDLAGLLNEKLVDSTWKRIPGSGALGTQLDMGQLTSDLVGVLPFTKKTIKLEAKVGYGGDKPLTIKKEWLDKIKMQAETTYSIPVLCCKFSGAREGVKIFFVLDFDTFCNFLNFTTDLYQELEETIDKQPKV